MPPNASIAGLEPRLHAARRLAQVLKGEPFQAFTASELADPRERAMANRLVTIALRRHGHLDIALGELMPRGLPPRSGLLEPALRCGLGELLFAEGAAAHSAIHLAVEIVKGDRRASRYSGLANGVLRAAQRSADRWGRLDPLDLFPAWLRARWTAQYGEEMLLRFADALLAGPALDITLREPDAGLAEAHGAQKVMGNTVRVLDRDRPVEALPGFAEGRWWVQDAAAALPARLLDPHPGDKVLDMCAAPGGKTMQLIASGAEVTALDSDSHRVERLRANLGRVGMTANVVVADAADYRPDRLFDRVLLDAPCSATGTFRRHPEVIWQRKPGDAAGRAELQRKLLANAAGCLKPGGIMVFCTCSLEPEEGESIAAWASSNVAEIEPIAFEIKQLQGLEGALTREGFLRTHPGLAAPGPFGGTLDGFFAAAFQRQT